jgi:prophage DNA circulation protein
MADKYSAKLDSFGLDIETIEDSFEKSIAKYEFPYRDGALLEDMGLKARSVKIRCYFYEETYESHKELLEHLKKKELFELLHPKYGMLKGSVESISVRHDDRKRTAEIDITFVENLITKTEPQRHVNVEYSTEEAFQGGQFELIEEFESDVRDDLGTEAMDILTKELDPLKTITEQFSGISIKAREYLKEVDSFVSGLTDTLSDITNPVDSVLSIINFPNTIAGITIGSLARTLERFVVLHDSFRVSLTCFLSSLRSAFGFSSIFKSGLAGKYYYPRAKKHTKIAAAQRLALETAYIYRDDETKRQQVRKLEKVKSFDALGNYVKPEPAEQIMTINEIESTLAGVRTDIQSSVDESRQMESLKDMALNLLIHVNDIKLEREKIVDVEIDNEMPLHLVCLKYGLPYNYAERIHSINHIKNPNFTPAGEVRIYAR